MNNYQFVRSLILLGIIVSLTGFRLPGYPKEKESQSQTHQEYRQYPSQPRQIALLLPLSGKHADAARAIREGFLASYYGNSFPGAPKPIVRVYDTSKEQDVQRIYLEAVDQGADFVVGPLTKDDVLRLSQLSSRSTQAPILALNYHPQARMPQGKLIQFSLLPESEAVQLAEKALQKGYQRASIIVPDNPWGHRIAGTFTNRWQAMGGQVVKTVFADPLSDQATAVRQLLGVVETPKKESEKKSPLDKSMNISRTLEMDVIIMAADPQQARQLKPLFDFYYADTVPVLATSSVYSGQPDPKVDHDLNGVVFCNMPWLVDASRHQQVEQLLAQQNDRGTEFDRLFAMGVDAYQLTSQLGRLQSGSTYHGATGNLYLTNQQIHQNLVWAKMVNGVPRTVAD